MPDRDRASAEALPALSSPIAPQSGQLAISSYVPSWQDVLCESHWQFGSVSTRQPSWPNIPSVLIRDGSHAPIRTVLTHG